jgi:abhydrolase domain-containing protein 17
MFLGYGASDDDSEPTERGCYEAADAAFDYVTSVIRVSPESVILYGRSLGSGPTIELAKKQPKVAGVVLQSPLTSGIRTKCCGCVAWSLCCIDVFASIDKAPQVAPLTLILHGMNDNVVPCENGQALYEALPNTWTPLWVDGAGHNDMEAVAGPNMLRHTRGFLERCAEIRKNKVQGENTVSMTSTSGDAGYQGEPLPLF